MTEQKKTSEAQRRANKKYYEANKARWRKYNSTDDAKAAKERYEAKRGSRAEYMRAWRAKKKIEKGLDNTNATD
jgi:hypothetical protein